MPRSNTLTADEIRWDPDFDEDRPETADPLLMNEHETRCFARLLQRVVITERDLCQKLMVALADQTQRLRLTEARLRRAHLRILELERGPESSRGRR